ncbi:hypothetical protein [Nocardioides sp. B-3]|uniref:hypothetical protein n=1 Tax=Nocardioides sp. B-3 TaxID=2895565 RepID=UPI002153A523|nr:hypothetical protein [Nocardioides sp. B-3]UUZ59214.1 hypothetical protein LP418_25460 [Nocardioides sp. B-3]
MRFNPKADIGAGRVDDVGGSAGSSRLPIPTSAGGGKLGPGPADRRIRREVPHVPALGRRAHALACLRLIGSP